jgi:hypothetical protein
MGKQFLEFQNGVGSNAGEHIAEPGEWISEIRDSEQPLGFLIDQLR